MGKEFLSVIENKKIIRGVPMSNLTEAWWASSITSVELFDPSMTKNLEKAELMKIRYILEIEDGNASDHKILLTQRILDTQDSDNPFIIYSSDIEGYIYNPFVDFWAYIKKAKKYR